MTHGEHCPTPYRGDCLTFSTDGTRIGVEIAHTMGTMDEDEILNRALSPTFMSDVDKEQADWESA
jgi:hypothetical protein